MPQIHDHDAYIRAAPDALRPLLTHLRGQLRIVLPDAQEDMQYKMPGFMVQDAMIAGFAAFRNACGLYVSKTAIRDLAKEIAAAGLKASKTGVTFTPANPIPDELVRALAAASLEEQTRSRL